MSLRWWLREGEFREQKINTEVLRDVADVTEQILQHHAKMCAKRAEEH
jgi:hypothetical protein